MLTNDEMVEMVFGMGYDQDSEQDFNRFCELNKVSVDFRKVLWQAFQDGYDES